MFLKSPFEGGYRGMYLGKEQALHGAVLVVCTGAGQYTPFRDPEMNSG